MAKKPDKEPDHLNEVKQAIKNKDFGSLYFFHGKETFLLNYYLEKCKSILLDPLTEAFNFHRMSPENFDIDALSEAVENMPMMADHTVIQLDDIDFFKFPEAERSRMAAIFSDLPEYCTIFFVYTSVPWNPDKRLKKLWSAVNEHGCIVEFRLQDQRELADWVSRHFRQEGKQISRELCEYLIELTDGSMTSLNSEIKKISAYSGAEKIVKSDIDAVTEPVLDAIVFQLTDLMGAGRYEQALQKLQDLFKMQQEPIPILGAIGMQMRRLSVGRIILDNGKSEREVAEILGQSEFIAKRVLDSSRKVSTAFCAKAAECIMETDYRMKTSFDQPDRLLQQLVLTLAMEAMDG